MRLCTVAPLCTWANYLSNSAAVDFIDDNLNCETAPYHLACADLFSFDKIAEAAVTVAAENFDEFWDVNSDANYADDADLQPGQHVQDFWALHPKLVIKIYDDALNYFDHVELTNKLGQYIAKRPRTSTRNLWMRSRATWALKYQP